MVRVYLTEITEISEAEGKGAAYACERQSAAARRLLMLALEKEYPESAGAFRTEQVVKDERGKPYLAGYPDIHISLSHSGRLAACAVGKKPVGVDVELRKMRQNRERVARKLHAAEQEWLAARAEEEQEKAFYDLWVRKESFLKATGEGLRLALDSFCTVGDELWTCGLYSGTAERVRQNFGDSAYFIRQYELAGGRYSLAVCSEETDFVEEPVWLSAEREF